MIDLYELNPHKMTTAQEKAQCVSWFIKGPFTLNETNETLKKTNQCDILDCVCFIMTFTHNEPVSLVSITNRHFRFLSKKSH